MLDDGELLLKFLRLTGWRTEIHRERAELIGYAARPESDGSAQVHASGPTRGDVAAQLFAKACAHVDSTRPAFGVPPELARFDRP